MNTIRENLYNGCTARIIGHTEVWLRQPPGHPVDSTRYPGYNQQSTSDILVHCNRLKKMDVDVLMFNTYAIGSWENRALELYLPATKVAGLNFCINIDKGIYHGKTSPINEIRNYLTYIRKVAFSLTNYEKYNGKFIVTYFAVPGDDPTMFAQIEKENTDCIFVYNSSSYGHNQMSWVQLTLENGLAQWCAKYSTMKDGGLYIPHVSPGFNDTFKGHSVWNQTPPRIWPFGVGPNAETLKRHFDVINKYYSPTNQLPYLQLVTMNDYDEGTNQEPKVDGTPVYYAPVPPTIDHIELWMDDVKIVGAVSSGTHELVVEKVMSDGSVIKTNSTFVV